MTDESALTLMGLASRRGASDSDIAAAERDLGASLPDDYKTFLRESDGIEGFIAGGQEYLMLWRAADLAQLNRDYRVAEFMPQIVLVGSNGGNDAYGFIRQNAVRAVYARIPFLDLGSAEPEAMGGTLVEFVGRLRGVEPQRQPGDLDADRFVPVREALMRARSVLPASAERYRDTIAGYWLVCSAEEMEHYYEVALWALAAVGRAVSAPPEFWSALDDAARLMGFDEAWRARECRP